MAMLEAFRDLCSKYSYDVLSGAPMSQGRYSLVHVAYRKKPANEKAVLKCIVKNRRDESTGDIEWNCLHEAKMLEKLDHENIIKLYSYFESEHFVVMELEFEHQGNLREHVHKYHSLSETECNRLIKEVVSAVSYLHAIDIVHRDLKCSNVVLCCCSFVRTKLIDFEFSKDISLDKFRGDAQPHTFCGSPTYAAPQLLDFVTCDLKAADVWAIGVMLFFMLTETFPFGSGDVKSVRKKIRGGPFWPLGKSISDQCKEVVMSALTVDEDNRATIQMFEENSWVSAYNGPNCVAAKEISEAAINSSWHH
ncbi:testis-specific serine/threonine-protein kinase 2-like [Anneissia japonica]|uniref:testis-specific serine/threonine-protein kinase 2-like n=1 Tax=Anneissia japonica TaxID=1529436 RepID=UPI0014259914|nr:testis-specific serine/threonine-protein kinase 2-like [Anneissia japonica]